MSIEWSTHYHIYIYNPLLIRSFNPFLYDSAFNSSLPGQNGHRFADDIFKCIFFNENFCVVIRISLKFVPKVPIYNKSASVQVMAWHRTGAKPLLEPMLTQFTDAYRRH